MAKYLDWLIPGLCILLAWGAAADFISDDVFDPLPAALSTSLLILVRVVHQHAPKWIAAKYRRK